ncbi:hypothetical protein AX16_010092 [Volvariella volvacea WC 439]|nr:hypothetical protein AX16_010092 [Volvariella volvacea WC 439]
MRTTTRTRRVEYEVSDVHGRPKKSIEISHSIQVGDKFKKEYLDKSPSPKSPIPNQNGKSVYTKSAHLISNSSFSPSEPKSKAMAKVQSRFDKNTELGDDLNSTCTPSAEREEKRKVGCCGYNPGCRCGYAMKPLEGREQMAAKEGGCDHRGPCAGLEFQQGLDEDGEERKGIDRRKGIEKWVKTEENGKKTIGEEGLGSTATLIKEFVERALRGISDIKCERHAGAAAVSEPADYESVPKEAHKKPGNVEGGRKSLEPIPNGKTSPVITKYGNAGTEADTRR